MKRQLLSFLVSCVTNAALLLLTATTALPLLTSCSDSDTPATGDIALGTVSVGLSNYSTLSANYSVTLRNTVTNAVFSQTFDSSVPDQRTVFSVPPGIYEATAAGRFTQNGKLCTQNGSYGQIIVRKDQVTSITIDLRTSVASQLVIKELYNGGCMMDDGVTKFQNDKCVILYNNTAEPAMLTNLCIGFSAPYNAQATNNNYNADGRLTYESEGFTPVLDGYWYFPQPLTVAPFSQVVVNVHGAIDNTQTVSQSVNYANADYYCMYDPEVGYSNTSYYPTPSSVIPTSHYLKAAKWSLSNAWPLSVSSPAMVLFLIPTGTPAGYAADTANQWYDGGTAQASKLCIKIPNEWIIDAVEVYSAADQSKCSKRLTADIDAGYVWLTNFQGHSLYRNVDREATEALAQNEGRLVYGYTLGDDPSTIDAEASTAGGASIVYQDTNNSTTDFHERALCSLRNK